MYFHTSIRSMLFTLFICFCIRCFFWSISFLIFGFHWDDFSKHWITFANTYLLSCLFYWCWYFFHLIFVLRKTFRVIVFVTKTLLIEILHKFRTIKYWSTLSSNISYFPSRFIAFNISLTFALQQVQLPEICTLFRTTRLSIFFILMISITYRTTLSTI